MIEQFLCESIFTSFLAFLAAMALVELLLPSFNELFYSEIPSIFNMNMNLILSLLGIVFIVGIFAGSYPAFFLSAFKPVNVLQGNIFKGRKTDVHGHAAESWQTIYFHFTSCSYGRTGGMGAKSNRY